MITPEEFPYIKSLYVNDCYTYKDFNVELHEYKPFSHLILTGKNGSGKSTILRAIDKNIGKLRSDANSVVKQILGGVVDVPALAGEIGMVKIQTVNYRTRHIEELRHFWFSQLNIILYSYFKVKRTTISVMPVESPSKETVFTDKFSAINSTDFFVERFKQYLVNRKIEQAFYQIENQRDKSDHIDVFFSTLTKHLRQIFEDENLRLVFRREDFEFFIQLSDGRKLTFDVLSEGFSALLSILMDLFMRVDLIRKQVSDYSYNPCGIVLIDEPETHLHLQLQEQVLPLLTSLFPNIQFIAATHSPAVIASIKQATIFDLTTKESRGSEETVGRSYSELMRGHFGLKNEYSGIADELFQKVDLIIKEYKGQPDKLKDKLQQFFVENEAYFSPTFRVELESMILENA